MRHLYGQIFIYKKSHYIIIATFLFLMMQINYSTTSVTIECGKLVVSAASPFIHKL